MIPLETNRPNQSGQKAEYRNAAANAWRQQTPAPAPVTTELFNKRLAGFRVTTQKMGKTLQNWTSPEDLATMQKSYADQARWLANASRQLRAQNPYDTQLNQQLDSIIDFVSGTGEDIRKYQRFYGNWANKDAYDRDMRSYTIATMDVDKARAEEAQLRQQISKLKEGGLKNLRQIGELTKQLGQKNWDITQATKYQAGVQKRQMYETLDLDSAQQEVELLRGQLASLQKQLEKTVAEKKQPASTYAASSQLKNKDDATIADLKAQIKDVQTKIAAREQDIAGTREYRDSLAYLKEKEANDQRLQELDMRQAIRNVTDLRRQLETLKQEQKTMMKTPASSYAAVNSGKADQQGGGYAAGLSVTDQEKAFSDKAAQIQQLQQQINAAEKDVRDANVLKKVAALQSDAKYDSWIQAGMNKKDDIVVGVYNPNKTKEEKGSVVSPLVDSVAKLRPNGSVTYGVAEQIDLYSCMTQEEYGIYCGLIGKGDTSGAREYLRYLDETLKARRATYAYENMAGIEKALYWLPAGLESGVSGIGQWFSTEPQPVSQTQMVSSMVQQEASEINPILGYAYSAGNSIANMAPSILVSTAMGNPLAGAAFMGFNAGGNAYADALRQGKSWQDAMGYGAVSGLSEAGLSYMLSGIGKLSGSGNLTRNAMSKLDSISNVATRAAGKFGVAYAGELVEEELQLFLDPFYRKIFFNEAYDAPTASEIFETAFVTLLTTAAYEGNNTIKGEMDAETYRKLYEHKLDYLTADILNIDPDSELAQRMQKRMDEGQKITADQIRSLVQEYGNALAKASPEALEAHIAYIEQQNAEASKQDFAPDLSKYSGRQLESVKRAVESGVLNNTRMTHTMVDLISKLEADKGVAFHWMDNEKLKESGFALEGKIVNGVKTAEGILLNVDSHKAMNTVVGHEIAHVLEGTEFYDSFRQLAVKLAKAKGEYDSRMADLKQLYKEGTDLEAELVADIVGDYIFTDELFIRSLQTGKPGLFRAVYDEIKYLRRMATAGSKEAKALIKAEKLFEKLYRQPVEARADSKADTNGQNTGKTEYSYDGLPDDAFYNENYSYIYGYNFLTAQKKMTVVDSLPTLQELQTDGRIDREKVLNAGYRNILENGGTKDGDTYSIINTYTKKPLQIGKNSITHGLGATSINAKRTNARLAAVIGELCKNAIPICCLPNTHNVRGTYGMAVLVNSSVNGKDMSMIAIITVEQQNGNVQSVDFVDVAHAVSGRLVRDKEKENRSAQGTPPGTKSEWATRFSSIRIAQFLEIVNMTHQGFLSDDVISKLGEERRGSKKNSILPIPHAGGFCREREYRCVGDSGERSRGGSIRAADPGGILG